MNRKKIIHGGLVINLLLLSTLVSFAQKKDANAMKHIMDSVKMAYMEQLALKNPVIRQASISSEVISKASVHSKLDGDDFFKSDAQIIRNKADLKVPVIQWGSNSFAFSLGMLHQHIKMNNIQNYNSPIPVSNKSFDKTLLSVALSYNKSDSLFNVPVVYGLGLSGAVDPGSSGYRFTYLGIISFQIKRTADYSLSLGAAVVTDPSMWTPVFPLIIYTYKFRTDNLEFMLYFPYRLYIRKEFSANSYLSLGAELGGSLAFFDTNNDVIPHNAAYATTELKYGLLYEYRVSRKIVLGMNGGILSPLSSKVFNENAYRYNAYFIKNKMSSEPYINISISFLPFIQGLKLR